MNQSFTVTVLVCAMAATLAAGQESSAPQRQGQTGAKAANADAVFMRTAAMDGLAEVEHGRLAAQNASAADVKQFAQRMVDDHSKANEELKGLAAQKNVTLPAELDQKHRAMQDKLAKLKGAAFDKAYMSHMVMAHQQAVTLFQREAKTGKDPETKAWAAKTLPVLEEHHKSARTVNTALGKTAP
jgi:putative membrane protein